MRLLLVGDDDQVGDALAEGLTAHHHEIQRRRRGLDLLTSYRECDAVILELSLPDMPGMQALRQFREVSSIPVVVLADQRDERSLVRALRLGADDCVTRPPRLQELIARLEKATRNRGVRTPPAAVDVVVTGDVRVDLNARRVVVAGTPIMLTHKEFELIKVLVEWPGRAVSRQQLMDRVWGDAVMGVSRSLDVHMAWLRGKLDRPGLISTVRGYGYRWGDAPAQVSAVS
ncbi:response regulator transcription factor [Nocardia sp. NEAU-G5]|uniref:Response regulator transcription factor n=1 Tax=Nocardia albiluteola TaxID=2842303 RepID=A0ABS6B9T0_9NOCA|nr:response regulator transcription factor [Nocardia albiluteola]MBU3066525.1 response regulator transcription factor [Nocardia albiluteola]